MFKVDDYKVVFRYTRDSNKRPIATQCVVLDKTNSVIARDNAYCNPVDQFNREVGRKLALARTLRTLFPRRDTELEYRKRFWNAYFKMRANHNQ